MVFWVSIVVAYLFLMSDQCALDKSGGLEEAEDIEFFFSESETMPLRTSTSTQATSSKQNSGNTGESYSIQVISFTLM